MFVIFDLDGTLALTEHRQHFLDGETKDWDGFYNACVDDPPNDPLLHILSCFWVAGYRVVVWSGRCETVRYKTMTWLYEHGVPGGVASGIRMRGENDYTPDDQLKAQWLAEEQVKPDLVFDDRQKVVDMWRSHGIVCCQVAPGNF